MIKPIILYEDNHLLVVYKKAGILSQSDNTKDEDMLTILKKYLKDKYNKPGNVYLGLVHRLDRPTEGIMVFAKTSKAAARLAKSMQQGDFHKSYYAVIEGYLENKEGTLKDKLEKKEDKTVLLNTKNGKEAILEYKVLEEKNNLSLLKVDLKTGRYHQIRVQFASRNHPLYADSLYGNKKEDNLALCAYSLSFPHPTTKEILNFEIKPTGNIWKLFEYLQNN